MGEEEQRTVQVSRLVTEAQAAVELRGEPVAFDRLLLHRATAVLVRDDVSGDGGVEVRREEPLSPESDTERDTVRAGLDLAERRPAAARPSNEGRRSDEQGLLIGRLPEMRNPQHRRGAPEVDGLELPVGLDLVAILEQAAKCPGRAPALLCKSERQLSARERTTTQDKVAILHDGLSSAGKSERKPEADVGSLRKILGALGDFHRLTRLLLRDLRGRDGHACDRIRLRIREALLVGHESCLHAGRVGLPQKRGTLRSELGALG